MKIIKSASYLEKEAKKKKKKYNEYAVCTESIGSTEGTAERSKWGPDAEERYKRCKEKVKKQN